jgi:small redox-active disulfide protein 2
LGNPDGRNPGRISQGVIQHAFQETGKRRGNMKKIEIFGTGCPKCRETAKRAKQAIKEMGVDAEVVKVENIEEIMDRGVLVTPALAVDGEVRVAGKIPGVEEIKTWIQ